MKINKLILLTLLISILALTGVFAQSESRIFTIDSEELGMITIETKELTPYQVFRFKYFNIQPFAISLNPTVPYPGQRVNVQLILDEIIYNPSGPGLSRFFVTKNHFPFFTKDISNSITCTGCSIGVSISFNAPLELGTYVASYEIRSGDGTSILDSDSKTFQVMSQVIECPTNTCTNWKFFDRTTDGHGKIESRTCSKFGSPPSCNEDFDFQSKTICDNGYVITGTNLQQSNGFKTCSLKSSCNEGDIKNRACSGGVIRWKECINGNFLDKSINCESGQCENNDQCRVIVPSCSEGETVKSTCDNGVIIITDVCQLGEWVGTGEQCPIIPGCTEGEVKEEVCFDGQIIEIEVCTNGQFVPTGQECEIPPPPVCKNGETKKETCEDDSEIITFICKESEWESTGEQCKDEPGISTSLIIVGVLAVVGFGGYYLFFSKKSPLAKKKRSSKKRR